MLRRLRRAFRGAKLHLLGGEDGRSGQAREEDQR